MYEFRTLVKKCGIVLVGFYNKAPSITLFCGYLEVRGDTTDQEAWLMAGTFQNKCQHAGCRSLAVRTCNGNNVAFIEHVDCQPLRT